MISQQEDKVATTKTTNTEVNYATRSLGKEKVEKSVTDYKTGQTKTVSEKTVAKEGWGLKAAGLIGFDLSRDVVVKGPEQVKKKN